MQPRGKRRRAIGTVLLMMFSLGAAAGLSGCEPEATAPSPPPSPTATASTPILPSNEEALAIVEELVPAASKAEARARETGDYADLEQVAGDDYVAEVRTSNEQLAAEGLTVTGDKVVDSLQIQSVTSSGAVSVIQSYGCYDISGTTLTNASGENARTPEVPLRVPIVFRIEGSVAGYLLIETSPWSGPSTC